MRGWYDAELPEVASLWAFALRHILESFEGLSFNSGDLKQLHITFPGSIEGERAYKRYNKLLRMPRFGGMVVTLHRNKEDATMVALGLHVPHSNYFYTDVAILLPSHPEATRGGILGGPNAMDPIKAMNQSDESEEVRMSLMSTMMLLHRSSFPELWSSDTKHIVVNDPYPPDTWDDTVRDIEARYQLATLKQTIPTKKEKKNSFRPLETTPTPTQNPGPTTYFM